MRDQPAIFRSPRTDRVADALVKRLRDRARDMSDDQLQALLEDTIYQERLRLEEDAPAEGERERLEASSRAALEASRKAKLAACEALVRAYADEIHNRFSTRAYGAATRLMPRALTALVSNSRLRNRSGLGADPNRRLKVQGAVEHVRALTERGTVLLTPTHLSNLDSPLLGYALYASDLPPVAYGAGLNLFTNPVMSFWMSRLGAYTVDRRKQGRLYKDALKDYSVELLRRGCHSLFFPGGTRSRSGEVEKKLKKGLLGTAIQAWQENLAAGAERPDVFIVPATISTSLVLEAETLIADALAREGKSRYIITDDEFSRPRDVASYLQRVIDLDESVILTFSAPLDPMGNRVDLEGRSLGPDGAPIDRRRYVCGADGAVEADLQRDRVYTDRLARGIVSAFHRDNVALSTHVAAGAAWGIFARRYPSRDQFQLVRLDPLRRFLTRQDVLARIARLQAEILDRVDRGEIRARLPGTPEAILDEAIATFNSFHTRPALRWEGTELFADLELLLFYRNRLTGYGLEAVI